MFSAKRIFGIMYAKHCKIRLNLLKLFRENSRSFFWTWCMLYCIKFLILCTEQYRIGTTYALLRTSYCEFFFSKDGCQQLRRPTLFAQLLLILPSISLRPYARISYNYANCTNLVIVFFIQP